MSMSKSWWWVALRKLQKLRMWAISRLEPHGSELYFVRVHSDSFQGQDETQELNRGLIEHMLFEFS